MTAPTSPGVVTADVRELVERLRRNAATFNRHGFAISTARTIIEAADMLERLANRPSLTEDEREQVRREALEEAALTVAFQEERERACYRIGRSIGNKWNAGMLGDCVNRIRALADRSEPRHEKEGDRG